MRPLSFHRVLCLLALLGVATMPLPAAAQTLGGLTLAVEAYNFDYDEDAGSFPIQSDPLIVGARAGYTFKFDRAWYLRLHGRYAQGDGEITNGISTGLQEFYGGGVEWGRDLEFEGTVSIAPFIGLGYRRWDDASAAVFGFDRSVEYYYVPVGLTAYIGLGSRWTMSTRLELDYLLWGEETDTYDLGGGVTSDLSYTFGEGWGAGLEVLFRTRMGDRFSLAMGPYFHYWDLETSDPAADLSITSSNQTMEAGLIFKINL